MNSSEYKGQLAVLKVESKAIEKEFVVSRPSLPCRYDLIIDDGKRLHRVQVKYAGGKSQCASGVAVASLDSHGETYSENEIDAIAVYIPSTDTVFWFSAKDIAGKTKLQIRIEPAKNNQKVGCFLQEDYVW